MLRLSVGFPDVIVRLTVACMQFEAARKGSAPARIASVPQPSEKCIRIRRRSCRLFSVSRVARMFRHRHLRGADHEGSKWQPMHRRLFTFCGSALVVRSAAVHRCFHAPGTGSDGHA